MSTIKILKMGIESHFLFKKSCGKIYYTASSRPLPAPEGQAGVATRAGPRGDTAGGEVTLSLCRGPDVCLESPREETLRPTRREASAAAGAGVEPAAGADGGQFHSQRPQMLLGAH